MNSIDPIEDLNEDNSKDNQNNDIKNSSSLFRNGFIKKQYGNLSSKEQSSKITCTIS